MSIRLTSHHTRKQVRADCRPKSEMALISGTARKRRRHQPHLTPYQTLDQNRQEEELFPTSGTSQPDSQETSEHPPHLIPYQILDQNRLQAKSEMYYNTLQENALECRPWKVPGLSGHTKNTVKKKSDKLFFLKEFKMTFESHH